MKILCGLVIAAGLASSASAQVGAFDAQVSHSYSLGQASASVDSVTPGSVFSNVSTFAGDGVANGGATLATPYTFMECDDITPTAGGTCTQLRFSIVNFNSAQLSIKPSIRMYTDNAGTPGTLFAGFDFNAVTVAGLTVTVLNFPIPTGSQFALPGTKFWAGQFYTGGAGTTSTTAAQMNNWGIGHFTPPDVGTSADIAFDANPNATQLSNNPAGVLGDGANYWGLSDANFGWEFVVPAPSSLALLGMGGLVAARRRRA